MTGILAEHNIFDKLADICNNKQITLVDGENFVHNPNLLIDNRNAIVVVHKQDYDKIKNSFTGYNVAAFVKVSNSIGSAFTKPYDKTASQKMIADACHFLQSYDDMFLWLAFKYLSSSHKVDIVSRDRFVPEQLLYECIDMTFPLQIDLKAKEHDATYNTYAHHLSTLVRNNLNYKTLDAVNAYETVFQALSQKQKVNATERLVTYLAVCPLLGSLLHHDSKTTSELIKMLTDPWKAEPPEPSFITYVRKHVASSIGVDSSIGSFNVPRMLGVHTDMARFKSQAAECQSKKDAAIQRLTAELGNAQAALQKKTNVVKELQNQLEKRAKTAALSPGNLKAAYTSLKLLQAK